MARQFARYERTDLFGRRTPQKLNQDADILGFRPMDSRYLGLRIVREELRNLPIPLGAVFGGLFYLLSDQPLMLAPVYMVLGAIFGLIITIWLNRRARTQARIASDRLVKLIETEQRPDMAFALYLRPFTVDHTPTGAQRLSSAAAGMVFGGGLSSRKSPTEKGIAKLCGQFVRDLPLICLGRVSHDDDAQRLVIEDERWQWLVERLSESAAIVFLVLGSGAGTRWEIEKTLRSPELMAKTVFIAPPNDINPSRKTGWARDQYESLRQLFQEHEYTMPNWGKFGRYFIFDDGVAVEMVNDVDPKIARSHLKISRFVQHTLGVNTPTGKVG